MEFEMFAQQGWQCPICRRVYSPTTPMCWYCGNEETITTTNLEIKSPSVDVDWMRQQVKTTSKQEKK